MRIKNVAGILLCFLPSYISAWSWPTWDGSLKAIAKVFTRTDHETPPAQEFPLKSNGTLNVSTQLGDIEIKGWKSNNVFIQPQKTGKKESLENTIVKITADESHVTAKIIAKDDKKPVSAVSFTIMVPEQAAVQAETINGTITIKECSGTISADTINGSIIARAIANNTRLQTVNGSIKITVDELSAKNWLIADASNGAITLKMAASQQAHLEAQTTNGSITSQLPLVLDLPVTILDKKHWQRMQQEITGTFGKGGAKIVLKTVNGSIAILKA